MLDVKNRAEDSNVEGWTVYRKLILAELERLSQSIHTLNIKLDQFREQEVSKIWLEITILKVKAGVAGFLAGSVGAIIVGVMVYFLTHK